MLKRLWAAGIILSLFFHSPAAQSAEATQKLVIGYAAPVASLGIRPLCDLDAYHRAGYISARFACDGHQGALKAATLLWQ